MQYAIYEENFPIVEKKLNSIAKKCNKYGNDFVFNLIGEEIRERQNAETKQMEYFKFYIVEVSGAAKIDNWECIAILECHESGNIIRRINTNITIPARFMYSKNICEHCNSNRYRKNLYIIHNVETNDWKQVGGNCLKLYTNGLSMEYVTAYMDGIIELEENDGYFPMHGEVYWDVKDILSFADEIIGKIGYFNANSELPTKTLVSIIHNNRLDDGIKICNQYLSDYKIQLEKYDFFQDNTEENVENIINYYLSLDDNTEFIHNVQVILKEKYCRPSNIGFLCYLPFGYAKHIQKEQETQRKKEQSVNSDYYGEIGKRYKDKKINSYEIVTSWCNDFGVTNLYRIYIDEGVLLWKTSKAIMENPVSITFTVKEHKEYKGERQTEVTRCKIAY